MSNICHRCGNGITANDYECPHCHCVALGGVEVPTPTPHAKTADEVAKMVTFIPSSISGHASIVIGPHNEAIQGYELRPITPGDVFAEKAAKEIQEWFAAAIREAEERGRQEVFAVANEQGIFAIKDGDGDKWKFAAFADNILDDAGNVRMVLEWSHNPLTNRIHAEIEPAQGAKHE